MSVSKGGCVLVIFPCSYFVLNKRTGFLIIKENAPPGSYQFQVRVSDDVWPDAVSSVSVHVRELRDDAIYNSGSLRLAGMIDTTHTHLRDEGLFQSDVRQLCFLSVNFSFYIKKQLLTFTVFFSCT